VTSASAPTPLAALATTRTLLFAAAWLGLVLVPVVGAPWQSFPDQPWLDGWSRFDTSWYQSIWEYGYSYTAGEQSNVNFFPLYPVLVGVVARPFELFLPPLQAFCLAGMVVSQIAFALALVAIHRLTARRLGAATAGRTLWLLAAFPFALFFSAVYTEALFLCLAAWAFERADARAWWSANLLAAACVLTRIPGVLVAGGIAIEYLRARRWRPDAAIVAWLLPAIAAVGLAFYFAVRFDDPLVFRTTQIEAWGRHLGTAHLEAGFARVAGDGPLDARVLSAMYLLSIPLFAALAIACFWRLGPGYGAFTLGAFVLAASTGLEGLGRYEAVLFPAFIVAAHGLRSRRAFAAVIAVGLVAQVWLLYLFTHWRLVT
jgi:Gpi18-like mannosyltransferase